jgi:hypothetical protein
MSLATKTPGARRAGPEEYCFDLATIEKVHGGPDYTTATGPCVEGERMIVALMRMPAGTGAAPHSHPNEQWIYIVEGFSMRPSEARNSRESRARFSIFPRTSFIP